MTSLDNVVIVGAGLAGHRAAGALRQGGYDGRLTVIGDELHLPYDRPPLSKQVLFGSAGVDSLYFDVNGLDAGWVLGAAATGIDTDAQTIALDDGRTVDYATLIVATGRSARNLPDAAGLGGVHVIRSIDDAVAFRAEATAPGARVVVVGAGFVGCEAAATLRKLGVEPVTLVDIAEQPLPVLGADMGRFVASHHEKHGVRLVLGVGVGGLEHDGNHVTAVVAGGEAIPADVVLVGLGSVPNTQWLADSTITLDRGAVVCDETLFSIDATNILAVGDTASFPHPLAAGRVCIEHWTNARETAELAAANLLASTVDKRRSFTSVPTFWSDQYDLKIKSAGFIGHADTFDVIEFDADKPAMVVEARCNGELVGAMAINRNRKIIDYTRTLAPAS